MLLRLRSGLNLSSSRQLDIFDVQETSGYWHRDWYTVSPQIGKKLISDLVLTFLCESQHGLILWRVTLCSHCTWRVTLSPVFAKMKSGFAQNLITTRWHSQNVIRSLCWYIASFALVGVLFFLYWYVYQYTDMLNWLYYSDFWGPLSWIFFCFLNSDSCKNLMQ